MAEIPGCLDSTAGFRAGDPPPGGYVAWFEWAQVQHKAGLRQAQCPVCGRWRFPQETCDHKAPRLRKLRPGLYEVQGITHRCHEWDRARGTVRIERCGTGDWRWETVCISCKACDPDGWPTLREAVSAVRVFCTANDWCASNRKGQADG